MLLAKLITASLSEGEKRRGRPDRAILQTNQSLLQVTVSPHCHGVAITMELGSDLKIAGMILVGGSENQPTPENQGLWRGTRPNRGLQLSALSDGSAIRPTVTSRPGKPVMSRPPMVAMFQVKRLKALSRRRRWISDACIRTDMALLLQDGALAGAASSVVNHLRDCSTSHKCILKWR